MKAFSLSKQYRRNLLTLHLLTITVISIVEIIPYIIFVKNPEWITRPLNIFLYTDVILPILINFTAHILARVISKKETVSSDIKNNVVVYAAFITSACIAIIHRTYIISLCSFVFPIVLSGFFNNKKLLNFVTFFSIIIISIAMTIILLENPITSTLIINIVIAYVLIFISFFASSLAISFTQDSYEEIENQAEAKDQLLEKIQLDGMTGLYNHETFDKDFASAIKRFNSSKIPFCLAIIDIDDFKTVNDTYGHEQGNTVLIELRNSLKKYCSYSDKVYRYGGEEFAILFFNSDKTECVEMLNNMKKDFEEKIYPFTSTPVTFSCGVDQYDIGLSAITFFNKVDKMLYKAKQHPGKNKIISVYYE